MHFLSSVTYFSSLITNHLALLHSPSLISSLLYSFSFFFPSPLLSTYLSRLLIHFLFTFCFFHLPFNNFWLTYFPSLSIFLISLPLSRIFSLSPLPSPSFHLITVLSLLSIYLISPSFITNLLLSHLSLPLSLNYPSSLIINFPHLPFFITYLLLFLLLHPLLLNYLSSLIIHLPYLPFFITYLLPSLFYLPLPIIYLLSLSYYPSF